MRITRFVLNVNDIEIASLSVRDLDVDDRFLIKAIVGLDTDELVPRFYGFGNKANSKFHTQSLKPRDIVIRIGLNPRWQLNETYSDVRDDLYRIISANRSGLIEIQLFSGASLIAHIYGFVTKLEAPLSDKNADVYLTLHCVDPMLYSVNQNVLTSSELSDGNPLIIFDTQSTAPHGFDCTVTFTDNTSGLIISDSDTDPDWEFNLVYDFLTGDTLYISSIFTNKELYVTRSSVVTPLMDKLVPGSMWPIIFPGKNEFFFDVFADLTFDEVRFNAAYWGV